MHTHTGDRQGCEQQAWLWGAAHQGHSLLSLGGILYIIIIIIIKEALYVTIINTIIKATWNFFEKKHPILKMKAPLKLFLSKSGRSDWKTDGGDEQRRPKRGWRDFLGWVSLPSSLVMNHYCHHPCHQGPMSLESMIIMKNITMLKKPACCMLMTLKAMTIIILTKVPLLTTSPQSRSCQLPHWRQWWRGNSTGCLSSGWAWEGRLAITISKTCLTKSFCFQPTSPKRDLQQIQNAGKATSWKMFHLTNMKLFSVEQWNMMELSSFHLPNPF